MLDPSAHSSMSKRPLSSSNLVTIFNNANPGTASSNNASASSPSSNHNPSSSSAGGLGDLQPEPSSSSTLFSLSSASYSRPYHKGHTGQRPSSEILTSTTASGGMQAFLQSKINAANTAGTSSLSHSHHSQSGSSNRHTLHSPTGSLNRLPAANTYAQEVEAIGQWFSEVERTLDEMAATKVADTFKEEMSAIEQWFRVLSDVERTMALYSLFHNISHVQMRFFTTVLQQMARRDPTYGFLTPGADKESRPSSFIADDTNAIDQCQSEFAQKLLALLPKRLTTPTAASSTGRTRGQGRRLFDRNSMSSVDWGSMTSVNDLQESLSRLELNEQHFGPVVGSGEHCPPSAAATGHGMLNTGTLANGGNSPRTVSDSESAATTALSISTPSRGQTRTSAIGLFALDTSGSPTTSSSTNQQKRASVPGGVTLIEPLQPKSPLAAGERELTSDKASTPLDPVGITNRVNTPVIQYEQPSPPRTKRVSPSHPWLPPLRNLSNPLPPSSSGNSPKAPETPSHSQPSSPNGHTSGLGLGGQPITNPPSSPYQQATLSPHQGYPPRTASSGGPSSNQASFPRAKSPLNTSAPVTRGYPWPCQDVANLLATTVGGSVQSPAQATQQHRPSHNRHHSHTRNPSGRHGVISEGKGPVSSNQASGPVPLAALCPPTVHGHGQISSLSYPTSPRESRRSYETISFQILNDVPTWLRSLRLHKYTPIFSSMTWRDMIQLDNEQLEQLGVSAMGARSKFLKVFEQIKAGVQMGAIQDCALTAEGRGREFRLLHVRRSA